MRTFLIAWFKREFPWPQVFAGAVSGDGKYAFNTANINRFVPSGACRVPPAQAAPESTRAVLRGGCRPVNKNTSDDAAHVVVTSLATAKVGPPCPLHGAAVQYLSCMRCLGARCVASYAPGVGRVAILINCCPGR